MFKCVKIFRMSFLLYEGSFMFYVHYVAYRKCLQRNKVGSTYILDLIIILRDNYRKITWQTFGVV